MGKVPGTVLSKLHSILRKIGLSSETRTFKLFRFLFDPSDNFWPKVFFCISGQMKCGQVTFVRITSVQTFLKGR